MSLANSSIIVAWTVIALMLWAIFNIFYNVYFHPLAKVPGPRSWGALRLRYVWALLNGTIVHDFEKLHQQYGPIVRVAPSELSFTTLDSWTEILQPGRTPPLPKDGRWSIPGLVAQGIVNIVDLDLHGRVRRLIAPAFTTSALRNQEPILRRYVTLIIDRLRDIVTTDKDGKNSIEIDIVPWLNFVTFDMLGDLAFGESFDCLQTSQYHSWIALLTDTPKAGAFAAAARFYPVVESTFKHLIPTFLKNRVLDHVLFVSEKVERRLNLESTRSDIMSHVIDQIENDGLAGFTMDHVNSTFMVLTIAGSETTATTLCGIVNYLAGNPAKLSILTHEIRDRYSSPTEMTLESLKHMPYLNAVIEEGLRLCPPVPWLPPRQTPEGGSTVCGVALPGGTAVSILTYAMGRDPNNFHDPLSFRPERYLLEAKTDPTSPFFNDQRQAYHPFSFGPRICIGIHLGMAQMRLILAKLVWEFDLEVPTEHKQTKWEKLRTFILLEKKEIYVKFKVREA
ncbi:putative cytochrome P450 [Triangularia verruculosa]|uniref:Cytochrome P450 n=1 Tax=Triangularia verruculosa TaxID=2587418 RepID=A0AAN7ATB1_9PEZI|nr:putative cytochrome P450 [Triangularia verruculosa]